MSEDCSADIFITIKNLIYLNTLTRFITLLLHYFDDFFTQI